MNSAEKGGETRGGNEVMAAGMAYAGKGIVLGVEDDEASARAEIGGKGRLDSVRTGCGYDSQVGEGGRGKKGSEGFVGAVFVVGEFRVGVNLGLLDGARQTGKRRGKTL